MDSSPTRITRAVLATGARPPPDFSVWDGEIEHINHSGFMFPACCQIGFISPADVLDEPGIRVSVHLRSRASIRFVSKTFELYSSPDLPALTARASLSWTDSQLLNQADVATFEETGLVVNKTRSEKMYLLRVFRIVDLPKRFLLRVPELEVGGERFWLRDWAYSFNPKLGGLSLCGSAP